MPQPKDKDWLNGYKNKTPMYVVYKRPTSKQGTHRLKVKGQKKIFHTNGDLKKAGVAILITDKINFEIKAMKREKEGHYIMIQGSIQEEDTTIMQCPSLSLFMAFISKSILSDMNIATPAFFRSPFVLNIFFHPFTFSLYVFLVFRWVSFRQHNRGLVFVSIHPVFVFWLGQSTHLHLR